MKTYIREGILIVLALLPIALMIGLWDDLPKEMPIHWNSSFEVDGFASKMNTLYLLLGLNLGLYITLLVAPLIDPKKQNMELSKKAYTYIRFAIIGLIFIISCSIVLSSTEYAFDMSKILGIGLPLLFMILGNFLPKIRKNYMIGIRTPWTLASEEIWKKTHSHGGKVWFFAGAIGLIAGVILPKEYSYIFILLIVASSFWIMLYSYLEFKKLKENE